ncbi:hypothetical protein GCM10010372_33360 [Streptomyces tauricus]|uniref:DUF397 domain-containing protein n=1 Tax=Streptomyces TaxID=1883 RepID=UPI001677741A|nr:MULTISPECIES: DUF397 domain-containing protein [Streptomyces]MCW8100774.1 DUF397 domain-containing protein [Streptomyces tauricus]UPZ30352.1 DUF397 domain-containing protein [Streptomyces sp. LRE541]GHA30745.1 hypothetical protein GCM10010372_33360 [Streptomyces tauricus]
MPELNWQKSTFSGGPEGECLYIATAPDGTIRLRESEAPGVILTTEPQALAGLLHHTRRPAQGNG